MSDAQKDVLIDRRAACDIRLRVPRYRVRSPLASLGALYHPLIQLQLVLSSWYGSFHLLLVVQWLFRSSVSCLGRYIPL